MNAKEKYTECMVIDWKTLFIIYYLLLDDQYNILILF
jgi:hypothetical protein